MNDQSGENGITSSNCFEREVSGVIGRISEDDTIINQKTDPPAHLTA